MISADENEEELPLDPAAEKMRRKLSHLLAISIGTLLIGLLAVFGAVVYKISGNNRAPGNPGMKLESMLQLPEKAEIVSVSLDRPLVLLHLRQGAKQSLLVFDLETGKTVSRVFLD